MATSYKVLGQSAPAATTATNVYTVPSATEAIISTIMIANRANSSGTFRLSVRPNGAEQANQHYIAYDVPISANESIALTLGITVDSSDIITAYASSADMSFSIFGSEITS